MHVAQKMLTPEYSLGHSEKELQRLRTQAAWYEPSTLRLFREAGISEGMRILDLGSGVGDVSFVARKLVGESGEVVGIDRSELAVAEAQQRAQSAGLKNVQFVPADLDNFQSAKKFDAVVGRLVLMYPPDPVETLRSLLSSVTPQAIFAFQEADYCVTAASYPEETLYARMVKLITEVMSATSNVRMGAHLFQTFIAAGLPAPQLHIEVFTGGTPGYPGFEVVAEIVRSLLPSIEKRGLASIAEIDIDTLAQRMRDDATSKRAICCWPGFVNAWTRLNNAAH
jgi:SAM-dependent methyltransferase